jgi:hypothetical protein
LSELQGVPFLVRVRGFAVPIVDYATNFTPGFVRVPNVLRLFGAPRMHSAVDALDLPTQLERYIFRRLAGT